MIKHVWPLVFFTTLAQMSVGTYLFLKLSRLIPELMPVQENLQKRILIIILVIALTALLVSFTHLGSPKNAVYAICNFRNSWLSREIFFMTAFVGILILENAFYRWFNHSFSLSILISFIGILISISLIYSMSRLYRLETVPSWNSKYTLLNFYNTSLMTGIFLMVLINSFKSGNQDITMLLAGIIFLIFQFILFVGFAPDIGSRKMYVLIIYGIVFILTLLRVIQILPASTYFYGITILFLFAGVLFERNLFYQAYAGIGV